VKTLAIDIDVGRIHAWSSTDGRVCYEEPRPPFDAIFAHELVLVEIANHVLHEDKKRPMKKGEKANRHRWAVFNMATCGEIFGRLSARGLGDRMLVSPSSAWTLTHPEPLREEIAGCRGQDNHDIRACRCMIFYHSTNPKKWVPYLTYVRSFDHSERNSND